VALPAFAAASRAVLQLLLIAGCAATDQYLPQQQNCHGTVQQPHDGTGGQADSFTISSLHAVWAVPTRHATLTHNFSKS